MHPEALGGGVAEFDAAVKTRACPFLNALGAKALDEMRSVYEQIDAGNYEALGELADRLATAAEQRADARPAMESEKTPAAAEAEEPRRTDVKEQLALPAAPAQAAVRHTNEPITRQAQPEAAQAKPDKAARADTLQPALMIDNELNQLRTQKASAEYLIVSKPLSPEVTSRKVMGHNLVEGEPEPAEIITVDMTPLTRNLFVADQPVNEASEPAEAASSTPKTATTYEPEDYAEELDEVSQFASLELADDETPINDYSFDAAVDWLPADNQVVEREEPYVLETAATMDFLIPSDDFLDAEVLPYPVNTSDLEPASYQEFDEETRENITETLLALKPEVAAEVNQLLNETAKLIKEITLTTEKRYAMSSMESYQQNVAQVSEKIVQLFELLGQQLSSQEAKRFVRLLLDTAISQPDAKLDQILMNYVLGDYGTHEGLAYSLKAVGSLQKIKLSLNTAIGRLALISPLGLTQQSLAY